ncbi:MAG: methionine adenosyltransferase [Candidatus Micrarchaeota archaeon]
MHVRSIIVERNSGTTIHKRPVEMVERKGIGHPDTLIDGIMENVSRRLSEAYINKFSRVRHHNVDKGLVCGGATEVEFGGGRFTKPIRIVLSGRAFGGVPVEEIAREATEEHIRRSVRHLDLSKGVAIQSTITEIWPKWDEMSGRPGIPLANDTSFGVGYAPLSRLEKLVLEVEKYLNAEQFKARYPWAGEDVKVMGLRNGDGIELTIAIAIVSRHITNMDEYIEAKKTIEREVIDFAETREIGNVRVKVNNADNEEAGSIYLTLSGTSAEMGDDGSVGRGNRANGLITPFRPMTLEATAGKNPVSHTGKIYSVLAFEIAERVVREFPFVENVDVYLLSRIGHPIDMPANATISLSTGRKCFNSIREAIGQIVDKEFSRISDLTKRIVGGLSVI